VAFRSAAVLRGWAVFKGDPVEILVPRTRNRRGGRGVVVRSARQPLLDEDITTVEGIPVTIPARTLLDLAAIEPEEVLERFLDDALRRRVVSLRSLQRSLQDPRRGRHRGRAQLQRLVDARISLGVTESPLESHVLKALKKAGLPIPKLQYEVRDGDRFVARLDFAYPEQRLAIEADGFRYHADRRAFDGDRARANELQARGWLILRVTSKHLQEDPEGVAAWVRKALSRYP
jgi:very-short-patch-repair endonuclease